MSDTATSPSDIMRSLSAPGLDPEGQKRRLADLARSVAAQREQLARREAELIRRERELSSRASLTADTIGRAEDAARAQERDLIEKKALVEVQRKLHEM